MPHVQSVNVGTPRDVDWVRKGRTAIEKSAVTGPVRVHRLGLEGDQVADLKHHGGVDQAVYAYAREDLDWWGEQLGQRLPDGHVGENLTTVGIDVNDAELGERWRVGSTLLEVCSVRTPCRIFHAWQKHRGMDATHWAKRFTAGDRPGPYLRVLGEGRLQAGDEIEVVHRPGHGVTVRTLFRGAMGQPELLLALEVVDDLAAEPRRLLDRERARGASIPID